MKRSSKRYALILVVLITMLTRSAFSQGGATMSSLTGVVMDASGAVVPGAGIVAKNNATAGEFSATSDTAGNFTIPALNPGIYTVTISLTGFKTVVLPDVQLIAAQPAKVKVTLEIGQLQETITVTGGEDIVQSESAAVSTTLSSKQIATMPMADHAALAAVAALPGINTTTTVRLSTVMGLPQSSLNMTIDGFNVQDNFAKSTDGFFARIFPRMDAVQEVTVSTANPGADSSGQGAVQMRFVTRSGTNAFQGSVYEYMRRTSFNTNYWFNAQQGLPKPHITLDTFGFRVGGPVKKDKLFFFFNYEEIWNPSTVTRQRTMLTAGASSGIFNWNGGPAAGINLYTLASAKGQTVTPDPIVARLLQDLQTSTAGGAITSTGNPITQFLTFNQPYDNYHPLPTTRVDYNVAKNHHVGISYYYQIARTSPDTANGYDPTFPGFPGSASRDSNRWSLMGNWRWDVSSHMVNEARFGDTGGPYLFGHGFTPDVFHTGQFSGWGGFALNPATSLISQLYGGLRPTTRDAPIKYVEDTISWLKGRHSINIGASYTWAPLDLTTRTVAPQLSLGVDANDPANSMFTTANFPGASSTDLTNARNLYALLTGRITAISGDAYLSGTTGSYVYLGDARQQAVEHEFGSYVQDSWKLRPNLTLSYGLRYELQLPFVMSNDFYTRPLNYCNSFGMSGCVAGTFNPNLFAPGSLNGQVTQFRSFAKGEAAYNTEKNNLAPSFGAAWQPHVSGGWLEKVLGADPVFRGGYSRTYIREGLAAVTSIYGNNPGESYTASRNMSLGNLVSNVSQLPLLLSNGFGQFGPGSFPEAPSYPVTPTTSNSTNEYYPDTQTPHAHSFNVSFQRTLSKNTAVDFRYVGTRMNGGWWVSTGGRNLNEYNLVENGFLPEFKVAQANLAANIAAGKGATFAYTGAAGTSSLPTMLAWLTGSAAASNTASYTGTAWSNSTLYGYLSKMNPSPLSFATYLQRNNAAYAANAAKAGLPTNFFLLNPNVSGAYVMGRPEDAINSRYDALQVELRRRLSGGFLLQGSYQYVMRSQTTNFYTLRMPGEWANTAVPHHVIKANWIYELPFGQGRKWGGGVGRLGNALIGGWSWNGFLRIQSGNVLDFGDFRLVGATDADLQNMFHLRLAPDAAGVNRVYMLPDDVVQNTIKAFSTDPTSPTGYGSLGAPAGAYFAPASGPDCINGYSGQCSGGHPLHHYVTGPAFFRADISIAKRIKLTERFGGNIGLDILNVFNNVDFLGTTMASPYTSTSNFQVTSAFTDSSVYDPGGRLIQLSFRINF